MMKTELRTRQPLCDTAILARCGLHFDRRRHRSGSRPHARRFLRPCRNEIDRSLDAFLEGRSGRLLHQLHGGGPPGLGRFRLERRAAFEQRRSRPLARSADARRRSISSTTPTSWATARRAGPARALARSGRRHSSCLRREIWRETDRQYRAAAEALIKVKTSQQVQVQTAEGAAPDFSHEAAAHLSSGRAWKFTWTASPGKSAFADTPPRSANLPRC